MSTSLLVLASASPRRMEILRMAGLPYAVHPVSIDETPQFGETPEALVLRLSLQKAEAAARYYPHQPVLGADTIVFAQESILGKPPHDGAARQMLLLLAGKTHSVFTGYSIYNAEKKENPILIQRVVETKVQIRTLSDQEIQAYIRSEEWRGKAGGYAIQGRFAAFVKSIEGNYENVVGLPLCALLEDLAQFHLLPSDFPAWLP